MAVAVAAVTMFSQSEVQAQNFNNGFQFGAGIRSSALSGGFSGFNGFSGINRFGGFNGFNGFGGFSRGLLTRNEDLPYFAKFPPVYYSNIIARPVGISPFAAPAGVRPIELDYAAPKRVTKKNPFYKPAIPVKNIPAPAKPLTGKTTWIANPYNRQLRGQIVFGFKNLTFQLKRILKC